MWPLKNKKKRRQIRQKDDLRRQFNFSCDKDLAQRLKILARFLETPLYPVTEHVIEVGMKALNAEIQDKMLRQELKRHITRQHLLEKRLNNRDIENNTNQVGGNSQ